MNPQVEHWPWKCEGLNSNHRTPVKLDISVHTLESLHLHCRMMEVETGKSLDADGPQAKRTRQKAGQNTRACALTSTHAVQHMCMLHLPA